jgi:hypothetical protein
MEIKLPPYLRSRDKITCNLSRVRFNIKDVIEFNELSGIFNH